MIAEKDIKILDLLQDSSQNQPENEKEIEYLKNHL